MKGTGRKEGFSAIAPRMKQKRQMKNPQRFARTFRERAAGM
jgi:hypothetical protein